jgi:antitoxin HicB
MLEYPIELTPDDNDTYLVTCPDLPEVTTFADDEVEAILRAEDAVEEALAARIAKRQPIPGPAEAHGRFVASLSLQTTLKVALYWELLGAGLRKADLARRMQAHVPQVDRLFDLGHASRMDQMEGAFKALGKRVDVSVRKG